MPVSALLGRKVQTLRALLSQIGEELDERANLSEKLGREITRQHAQARNQLLPLTAYPLSLDRSRDEERQVLEQRIDRLEQDDRKERVQRWQDTTRLQKEARQWMKEHDDLLQRLDMVTQHEQHGYEGQDATAVDQGVPSNRARRIGQRPYTTRESPPAYR